MNKQENYTTAIIISYLVLAIYKWVAEGFSDSFFHLSVATLLIILAVIYHKYKLQTPAIAWMGLLFIASDLIGYAGIILEATILGPDKIFHFTAGIISALLAAPIVDTLKGNKWIKAALIVSVAAAIGAAWEVYEYFFFTYLAPELITPLTYTDTILDLIADTLGALMAAGGWIWIKRTRNK